MALIIIEGCDGTGKTTLIQKLANEFNLPIIKSYKPKTEIDIYQLDNWANAAPRTPLMDRHAAISDIVYGQTLRGHTPSSLELARSRIRGNLLVWCKPPLTQVQTNIQVEEQMLGVKQQLSQIYSEYEKLMDELLPNVIYDYTQPGAYKALVTQINHFLHRNR